MRVAVGAAMKAPRVKPSGMLAATVSAAQLATARTGPPPPAVGKPRAKRPAVTTAKRGKGRRS